MRVTIGPAGLIGVNKDIPDYELPPEAWSDVKNMQFIDGRAISSMGWIDCFDFAELNGGFDELPWIAKGPPGMMLFARYTGSGFTYDVKTITLGTYAQTTLGQVIKSSLQRITADPFGGVWIINASGTVPKLWSPPTAATALVDLTNWPAGKTTNVLHPFGRFLVAYGYNGNAQRVKWSSSAPIGGVPATWDETDATQDSRQWDLAETSGRIVDALPLNDTNFIYKSDETQAMRWVGGTYVFDFKRRFGFGIVGQECVKEWKGKHICATPDDVLIHDGFSAESLLQGKNKSWYESRMSGGTTTGAYNRKAIMTLIGDDLLLGMPDGTGEIAALLRLNLKDGAQAIVYLDPAATATSSAVQLSYFCATDPVYVLNLIDSALASSALTFISDAKTYLNKDLATVKPYITGIRRTFNLGSAGLRYDFGLFDFGTTNWNGTGGPVNLGQLLERKGLTVAGKDRFGNPKNDPMAVKAVRRLWPKVSRQSATLNIEVGAAQSPRGTYTFAPAIAFDPNTMAFVEPLDVVGPYIAVRFSNADGSNIMWALDSYDLEFDVVGQVSG